MLRSAPTIKRMPYFFLQVVKGRVKVVVMHSYMQHVPEIVLQFCLESCALGRDIG